MSIHKPTKYDTDGNEVHGAPNLDCKTPDEKLEDILDNSLTLIQKRVTKGVPDRTLVDFIKVTLEIKSHLDNKQNPQNSTVNVNIRNLEERTTEELVALALQYANKQ